MAAKERIIDPSQYDVNQIVADLDEIRKYNPQRFEMEQLTATLYEDPQESICVGYLDLADDEFWIRGHMPGFPLMPGVLMCESAAQMASYFTQKYDLMGLKEDQFMGFGGMEDIRFRGTVRPGDRMILEEKLIRIRRGAMSVARFQAFVGADLVCEGVIKGVVLSRPE
ncbi:MAG: beta-hydroxyacyl-ACP dehydratase [Planctomycetales bacterium]